MKVRNEVRENAKLEQGDERDTKVSERNKKGCFDGKALKSNN